MKKSTRTSATESTRSQRGERLTDAVNRLADEVRVVRDVLDETREDLAWVTRNGIPGYCGEHSQLIRMNRAPFASDTNERLEIRTSTVGQSGSSEFSSDAFDALVSEIAEAVTAVGQEQVNLLLTALDDARAKLLTAIKKQFADPKPETNRTSKQHAPASNSSKPSEPGQLF